MTTGVGFTYITKNIVLPIHWLGNVRNRTIELLFYVIVSSYQRNFVLTVHMADMKTKTKQNKTKTEKGIYRLDYHKL